MGPKNIAKHLPAVRIILIAFIVLFIISFCGFLFILSVETTLLDSDRLFETLKQNGVTDELYSDLIEILSLDVPLELASDFKKDITLTEFEEFLKPALKDLTNYFTSARDDVPKLSIPAFGSLKGPLTYDVTALVPEKNFKSLRETVSLLMLSKYVLLGLSILSLFLIFLFAKTLIARLKYFGVAFLASGLAAFVLFFILPYTSNQLTSFLPSSVSEKMGEFSGHLISSIVSLLSLQLALLALTAALIGVVFLLASVIAKHIKK